MEEIRLTGHFIHYGKKNLNGRIYTEELAQEIVKEFNERHSNERPNPKENKEKYDEMVHKKRGPVLGQLGYPENGITDLSEVSHEIEEIHLNEENNSVDGTIKILDTPAGKQVQQIIEEMKDESPIGLSCRPRGTGTVNKSGEMEDYELISFDIVPTNNDAFANIKKNDTLKPLDE